MKNHASYPSAVVFGLKETFKLYSRIFYCEVSTFYIFSSGEDEGTELRKRSGLSRIIERDMRI